ncbi:hypothetical protein EJ02DRAFT_229402 [Clathrospora elynae]|uniref:Uncharacterized protein n=1 Tax=Clathrospora elynae TaxID=706981 RepID=A0A6A5SID8_9PLEO|nr:hypothetical protein EJ02DRAFT_229402 [Clathrospora elynae]
MATNLAVFKHQVEWSFRPSYVQTVQPNQHIQFPGADIREHKCLLLCIDGRWECHVYFPHMPLTYTNPTLHVVRSQSQHLDDYAMEIWTNQILLAAMDRVIPSGSRHHYPFSFREIRGKSNVKSEILLDEGMHNRADLRIPVAADLLGPLWTEILERTHTIPDTCLPSNAFQDPVLVIQNQNTKLVTKKPTFRAVRSAYMLDWQSRWRQEHLVEEHFWVDLGFERFATCGATTLLRKRHCNEWWASQLDSLGQNQGSTIKTTWFPWAGTSAGSLTVELLSSNSMRAGGLAYCKGYNVIN